jgi:DNA polymerase-3 subunit gamma/tau
MMATTELHKIPDTIRSRSQEFEFRTINTRAIAEQLTMIAQREGLDVEPAAIALIARAAEGSLRDAESSFDQVIAFAGGTITAADVTAVLGLVGRDLLLDIVQTVADEEAPRVFDLAARAVESGQDLRLLCRELSRVVRDMMVVNIDPARADEPDFAPEGDADRVKALAARFSREDLLRAFDVVARAEFEIRTSSQPRYTLEMALLRWIHLGKVQPLAEVLQALERGAPPASGRARPLDAVPSVRRAAAADAATGPPAGQSPPVRSGPPESTRRSSPSPPPVEVPRRQTASAPPAVRSVQTAGQPPAAPASATTVPGTPATADDDAGLRERFVEQIRQRKRLLHGTVVAQAQRVEVTGDVVTFCFTSQHRVLRKQVEENRGVLEQLAEEVAGRPMTVRAAEVDPPPAAPGAAPSSDQEAQARLRERALADNAVQAMLDVFPAQITDVEEIDR